MKHNIVIDEKILCRKYYVDKKSIKEVAKTLGVSTGYLFNYMKDNGFEKRKPGEHNIGVTISEEHKKIISATHKGKVLSQETKDKISKAHFKGGIGQKKKRKDGYMAIYFPEHPQANSEGFIMEHHLVMECFIGRHLREDEVVHHINHIRDDNRLENLKLMTFTEHARLHMIERHQKLREEKEI